MWIIVLLVLVVAAGAIAWRFVSAGQTPQVGSVAPEFTLDSQESAPVRLKDYRDKWVVLYFYPKDQTPGCTVEAQTFQRDQQQYRKRNAVVLGVSVDSVDSHKKFCSKEGLEFKLLADTNQQVSREYGSLLNFMFVKIAARHTFIIGPQGRIERVYTDVSPNQHSAQVLAALDELQKRARAAN